VLCPGSHYNKLLKTATRFNSSRRSNVALANENDKDEKPMAATICNDFPIKTPGIIPRVEASHLTIRLLSV
jgi:hypothetical protein